MKLKVCGMRELDNLRQVGETQPDFMGFIFYPHSPRFVGENFEMEDDALPDTTARVGVFVRAGLNEILEEVKRHRLNYVQLHGGESRELCQALQAEGIGVIKVFSIAGELPTQALETFAPVSDYYLFDTKTKAFGGSGKKFDWNLLRDYDGSVPYLLSGGIGCDDIEPILRLELNGLAGIDVNSGVEAFPGLKDVEKVKLIREKLR